MLQLPIVNPQNFNRLTLSDNLSSLWSLTSSAAWVMVALIGLFYAVVSAVLSYHWRKFGIDAFVMAKASLLYFSVSAALFFIMVVSLVFYLNSF